MTACPEADCQGRIDETGFCDACGREPAQVAPVRPSSARSSGRRRDGDPLSFPVFDFPDPSSRILDDPQIPDRIRRCANPSCRGQDTLPEQASGFCLRCGQPFSFRPSLEPGVIVGDQYRVVGCFARGGLGWIYLGHDTRLDDNPVVLKGLIDVSDADLASAERRALTTIDHPNIVRIYNFVTHPDIHTGVPRAYIVMEYVDGLGLSEVAEQSRHGTLPLGEPLRMEHVITGGLQVLAAFDYLHERGLLYCDLKPDNVIVRSGQHGERDNRIKLIDLGAVRGIGDRDSKVVGTRGFQVSDAEIAERGLTVQSDLHTVGETLHQLYLATADRTGLHDAIPDQRRIAVGIRSFRRVCDRARHPDPDSRFASAADMAEQLRGVLREIASLRDGRDRPAVSTLFAPTATLLDHGLGTVPPLDRWIHRGADESLVDVTLRDGRPLPRVVATELPVPLASPNDPAAAFLAAAAADDVHQLLDKLDAAGLRTAEAALARCRAALAVSDVDVGAASLRAAGELLADGQHWPLRWHAGLLAIAGADEPAATEAFDAVYAALPGEWAPKLALALCAEYGGRLTQAESYYEAVWRRDRSVVSAVFGLARVRLARGDRAGAVRLLDETPATSRHFDAARIATVRILAGNLDGGRRPAPADLRAAADRLAALSLDGGADTGPSRTRLETLVHEATLGLRLASDGRQPVAGAGPPEETELRLRLESAYRALARQCYTRASHSDLVDLANQYRPITFR